MRHCALYKEKIRFKGRLVVPSSLQKAVVIAMHTYSHPGRSKLEALCCRRFLLSSSPKKLISEVCNQCTVCQACKMSNRPSPDTLEHFPIPSSPFASLAMDFVELDPIKVDGQNFDSALVVVCCLSGYVIAIPTRKRGLDAAKLARIFWGALCFLYGHSQRNFFGQ